MKIKKIIFNILLFAIIFILVGCNFTFYTITFESNGGTKVESKQTVGYVARPTDPTKEGFEFAGWYLDSELTNEFNFKNQISENITLYAKWIVTNSNQGGNDNPSGNTDDNPGNQGTSTYTVTFESNGGSTVESKTTVNGKITTPNNPSRDNYSFVGWYKDTSLTIPFDFNSTVTSNITLYAKWNYIVVNYTVTFESNGGSAVESKTTTNGKITAPNNPNRNNYNFEGWYKDVDLTIPFDFNSTITSNITLYAKWLHIDDVTYNEGTFSSEVIDPYILAMDFSSMSVANSSEYGLYLDYAVLNKLSSITLTLQNQPADDKAFGDFIDQGLAAMQISATCQFHFNLEGNKLTTSLSFPDMATTSASNVNEYVQIPFVCDHKVSTRTESFTGFKINQVTNTYMVSDSDQLCYVLERGYRPLFSSDSCSAKRMYDAACNALISICDDTFTDLEKLHAIYDWLIENITYDETLLNYVVSNRNDLRIYKGFYLEGVFDDHRAVCDGISKAFMVMARIEGIECVQVSGTSKSSGVGHAWNKVRLNGRWYIVDATGGGVIIGNEKEMLTHRLFMCNDAYYSTNYIANEYTNLVADSEYSIYRDLKYTYNDLTHDYYIDDVDELADILAYYASLSDNSKTIDFYYAGTEEIGPAIQSAMRKAHLSGSYSTIQNDGSIIYKLN